MKYLVGLIITFIATIALGQGIGSAWVKVESIRYGDMNYQLSGYGIISVPPEAQFNANIPRSGTVGKIAIFVGKKIKQGEPLYELTTAATVLKGFAQAELQVKTAQKDVERIERLYQSHLATNSQLMNAQKALFDAQSNLNAEKQLGNNLQREIVRSPFDGVVTQIQVEPGMRVQSGQSAISLVANKGLYFQMGVVPELVSALKVGLPVHVSSVFDPNVIIDGEIKYITGMVDQTTGLVSIYIDLKDKHAPPGMRMHGVIDIAIGKKWQVPRSAVLLDGQGYYIFQVVNNHAKRVNVQAKEYDEITIIEGSFDKNLPVVVLGNYELKEGMEVKVSQ
ncbi:MAG: efflux RND transporter periplasmic adaptor subunit [Betaproteobacteria bacterium]|nr:efflux RND transporter periplasmic adaptor subunit [Betaproteobacteria bacterium]MDE2422845.1 efflux RND transporter periplasmic adaptor subunit [Betaproteobacteria bacterium]